MCNRLYICVVTVSVKAEFMCSEPSDFFWAPYGALFFEANYVAIFSLSPTFGLVI